MVQEVKKEHRSIFSSRVHEPGNTLEMCKLWAKVFPWGERTSGEAVLTKGKGMNSAAQVSSALIYLGFSSTDTAAQHENMMGTTEYLGTFVSPFCTLSCPCTAGRIPRVCLGSEESLLQMHAHSLPKPLGHHLVNCSCNTLNGPRWPCRQIGSLKVFNSPWEGEFTPWEILVKCMNESSNHHAWRYTIPPSHLLCSIG